jgi:hypothetical protein
MRLKFANCYKKHLEPTWEVALSRQLFILTEWPALCQFKMKYNHMRCLWDQMQPGDTQAASIMILSNTDPDLGLRIQQLFTVKCFLHHATAEACSLTPSSITGIIRGLPISSYWCFKVSRFKKKKKSGGIWSWAWDTPWESHSVWDSPD